MSVRISLALESREMFLSLTIGFSQERAAVVWTIQESISGLDHSLEITDQKYMKQFTSSNVWAFILISIWKPSWLFVIIFCFVRPNFNLLPCTDCIHGNNATSFFLFSINNNVICEAEIKKDPTSYGDTTLVVLQCIAQDYIYEDIQESRREQASLSNPNSSSEPVSNEQNSTFGLVV